MTTKRKAEKANERKIVTQKQNKKGAKTKQNDTTHKKTTQLVGTPHRKHKNNPLCCN